MSFDNIKLEKGLYTTSKGFTQSLEEIDPSENYIGTELEGLDAYQRQLKRFDIKVTGKDSDTVEKFFQTSSSSVLFPEYVSRAVRTGILQNDALSKILATTTVIDSLDYRAIEVESDIDDLGLANVGEGAFIPEAVIKTKSNLTKLKKRGRMLVASYEAIKFQKLDLFTILLSQIGASISNDQLVDAVNILKGCGGDTISLITANTLTYADLVNLWNAFSPYTMNTLICNGTVLAKLLSMSEFRDSVAGLNFHATGALITPLGAEVVRADGTNNSSVMVGIDNTCALEKVQAGEVTTDFDKLIDRQLERAVVSEISGFSPIFKSAVKYMG